MFSKRFLKTLITSMSGNLFEWYDFALFGYFAPVIGKLFFPSDNAITEILSAYATFAVGYIARPVGGTLFGIIGDKFGRKKALIATIFLMAVPTVCIGLLPTYNDIGLTATVLLIILRLLQGASMGGNYGGSITFTTEHSPRANRGLIGSFAVTSCLAGLTLGSATAALFTYTLDEPQLFDWGWRLPFLLGVAIFFVGFYMRKNIEESPEFENLKNKGEQEKTPLKELWQHHRKALLNLVFVVMLHDLSFYILFVYMTTHFTEFLNFGKYEAFTVNTINMIFVSLITVFAGYLSDRVGRKKVMGISALIFIAASIPLFSMMESTTSIWNLFFIQMIMAIAVGGYFGPLPAAMVETYPTKIRNLGVVITTNISGPLFGGISPMIVTYFIRETGSNMVPAYYLTIGAVISLLALSRLKLLKKHYEF